MPWCRTALTIPQVLAWADAHKTRTGDWPDMRSGVIPEALDANWRSVDNALRMGLRGLRGGSSLANLLQAERGVRNVHNLPPLTEDQILQWADAHLAAMCEWPTEHSGAVLDVPGEVWKNIDLCLRMGFRELPGNDSLAQLLARERGKRNHKDLPPLTVKKILKWADAHHQLTGEWPKVDSGTVLHAPEETWHGIESALYKGVRGLPGGDSLAQLLARERGARNPAGLPRLTIEQILAWADAEYERTGVWPTCEGGRVMDAERETWSGINQALHLGLRGLKGRSSLSRLLKMYRNRPRRKSARVS